MCVFMAQFERRLLSASQKIVLSLIVANNNTGDWPTFFFFFFTVLPRDSFYNFSVHILNQKIFVFFLFFNFLPGFACLDSKQQQQQQF